MDTHSLPRGLDLLLLFLLVGSVLLQLHVLAFEFGEFVLQLLDRLVDFLQQYADTSIVYIKRHQLFRFRMALALREPMSKPLVSIPDIECTCRCSSFMYYVTNDKAALWSSEQQSNLGRRVDEHRLQ